MLVLGIESSCDETGVALYEHTHGLLAHQLHTQMAMHAEYGGVVPELASRDHIRRLVPLTEAALQEAGKSYADIDAVAFTQGPGLGGALLAGASFANALAFSLGKPAIAVHHLEGHLLSPLLAAEKPEFPFVALLVSGGHTQLMAVRGIGDYTLLGESVDDAAGEAFDKIAKTLGLPYPGGPALEKLAQGGDASRYALPRMLLGRKDCDFSFSGLKTAAARIAEGLTTDDERRDLAATVQAAIASQLAERTDRAMKAYALEHEGHDLRFVVAGGVAANGAVRARLTETAAARGFSFHAPPLAYCTDNAAMIALAGAERLALGLSDPLDAVARPRWPLDAAAAAASPTHLAGRKGAKA